MDASSATCKKVSFKTSQGPTSTATKMAFHRFSPYSSNVKTPSGIILSPHKTPKVQSTKPRHRRTSTTGDYDDDDDDDSK